MRRRLLNIGAAGAAAVSLVLCALWVRSYWRADFLRHRDRVLYSWQGQLSATRGWVHGDQEFGWEPPFMRRWVGSSAWPHLDASFRDEHGRSMVYAIDDAYRATPYHADVTGVALPYWLVCLALGLPLMIGVGDRIRRRWRSAAKTGHCPTCDYDCRATPERCPECGTDLPSSANRATDDQREEPVARGVEG